MSSWDTILGNFTPEQQLNLTEPEQDYIPVYATEAFAAYYNETRCLFARFLTPGIWCAGVGTPWKFTANNKELATRKFRFLVLHLDEVNDFDFIQRTATFHGKQIKWDSTDSKWKYLNNRTVHFQSPSTSDAEEITIPGDFEKESSDTTEYKSNPSTPSSEGEDTLNVSNLLQEAETRIVATIQKLTSRPSTPSPQGTPSRPTSTLPGSSKNFQYQKKVHFLLHPYPRAKEKQNHYPRPLPALRDPRKPLQYPPQLSRRHQQYRKETPREYHRRFLRTDCVQEEQVHHRDHLVPQHHLHPQSSWQETSQPPNYWEVPLIPMMGTQQRPRPFGTLWATIIQ